MDKSSLPPPSLWKSESWNPVIGCQIASSGCRNCYAMHIAGRSLENHTEKYQGIVDISGKKPIWTGLMRPDVKRLVLPHSWQNPRKITVSSMTDIFHDPVPDAYLLKIWEIMANTPWHRYLLLTKRPERMRDFIQNIAKKTLPNLWIGATVEYEKTLHRIEILRQTPASIRFINFEPLIGDVGFPNLEKIDFVSVGGENGNFFGSHARPMNPLWVEQIFESCRRFQTGFCFHQWGAFGADGIRRRKKENGALFNGQKWREIPEKAYEAVFSAALARQQQIQKKKKAGLNQKTSKTVQNYDLFEPIS